MRYLDLLLFQAIGISLWLKGGVDVVTYWNAHRYWHTEDLKMFFFSLLVELCGYLLWLRAGALYRPTTPSEE